MTSNSQILFDAVAQGNEGLLEALLIENKLDKLSVVNKVRSLQIKDVWSYDKFSLSTEIQSFMSRLGTGSADALNYCAKFIPTLWIKTPAKKSMKGRKVSFTIN